MSLRPSKVTKSSNDDDTNSETKSTKIESQPSTLLASCLSWVRATLVTIALLLSLGYYIHLGMSSWELSEFRRVQATDATLRFVRVPSAAEPLQVRCQVHGKRIGTYFHIPGAGCSWLFNAVPLWPLPRMVPGVEFCAFSRQGLAFTDGAHDDITLAGVTNVTNQVVELIEQVTDPSLPLWVSGHSYGGLQVTLVAKRLLEKNRRPAAVVLVDASPLFLSANDPAGAVWETSARDLTTMFSALAGAAKFGIVRLLRTPLIAVGAPTALENIPEEYRKAYLYAYAQSSSFSTLRADFERYLTTAAATRREVEASNGPFLGDVRFEMLQASPQRFPKDGPVAQAVIDALQEHNSRSLFMTMSSRAHMRVIDEADHQFVSTPRAVKLFQEAVVEIVRSSK